jgi:hypothetical protein
MSICTIPRQLLHHFGAIFIYILNSATLFVLRYYLDPLSRCTAAPEGFCMKESHGFLLQKQRDHSARRNLTDLLQQQRERFCMKNHRRIIIIIITLEAKIAVP